MEEVVGFRPNVQRPWQVEHACTRVPAGARAPGARGAAQSPRCGTLRMGARELARGRPRQGGAARGERYAHSSSAARDGTGNPAYTRSATRTPSAHFAVWKERHTYACDYERPSVQHKRTRARGRARGKRWLKGPPLRAANPRTSTWRLHLCAVPRAAPSHH
jgi:hypothetical protein